MHGTNCVGVFNSPRPITSMVSINEVDLLGDITKIMALAIAHRMNYGI